MHFMSSLKKACPGIVWAAAAFVELTSQHRSLLCSSIPGEMWGFSCHYRCRNVICLWWQASSFSYQYSYSVIAHGLGLSVCLNVKKLTDYISLFEAEVKRFGSSSDHNLKVKSLCGDGSDNFLYSSCFGWDHNTWTHFSAGNCWIEKLMVPSESDPQELSNEWSCQ
jgi:hypothetical protein